MEPLYGLSLELVRLAPAFFAISISLFMALGWLFGRYRIKKHGEGGVAVRDSLVATIFGLSALVLGFTFSSASNHYDSRIETIRIQAGSIKALYASMKYLQPDDQIVIKKSLSDLLDLRLGAYENIESMSDIDRGGDKVLAMVSAINEEVVAASLRASPDSKAAIDEILLPQMRNLVTEFNAGAIKTKAHPPSLLMRFLYILLCIGALLIGYTMAVKRESDWFLAVIYVPLMGFGLHVILSLEYPNLLMPFGEFNRDLLLLRKSLG
ncbi:hypothetical protein [Polynucleobacter necessarius]|uniref:hypothetical protein n=1 Tax=Polynucleobacter necessarius TaxID=576610 RepID=UPI000FE26FF5|nr:hypothetical protein [Polynucleobacter necessarius]